MTYPNTDKHTDCRCGQQPPDVFPFSVPVVVAYREDIGHRQQRQHKPNGGFAAKYRRHSWNDKHAQPFHACFRHTDQKGARQQPAPLVGIQARQADCRTHTYLYSIRPDALSIL
jgi:hypothetical protein